MGLVRLGALRRGRIFWFNGQRCKLLYANSCRARVRLPSKPVRAGEREFKATVESDWAPSTMVEVRD